MRKITIIVPGWLVGNEGESVLRQNLPNLAKLTELGTLAKVAPLPRVETPEALLLGIAPDQVRMAQGPLTVSALGADPPERSTHFHLSVLSLTDSVISQHPLALPPEQVDLVLSLAKRLNTPRLTVVAGESVDHGLVWEGMGDIGTTTATEADGQPYRACLPEGDYERPLRQFIDDSVNILAELEMNERRVDEGLLPINLLWPWGQGMRTKAPNLALRRGEPAMVLSDSLRLAGLTRLVGYRHGDRRLFGTGMNVKLEELRSQALKGQSTLIVFNAFERLAGDERIDERGWLTHEFDERLLKGLLESAVDTPTRLTLLAPRPDGPGLGVTYETKDQGANVIPFDERALEERLSTRDLATWVDQVMAP